MNQMLYFLNLLHLYFTIVGYENKQYSIINDETIQITYYNEKKLESINEEDLKRKCISIVCPNCYADFSVVSFRRYV